MANTLLDLFYSLTHCLCCFPSTPQLKINNRSFRMLRLLGEVCPFFTPSVCRIRVLTDNRPGWLLLRLSRPRYHELGAVRAQEDSLSLWRRVRVTSPERSGSVHTLLPEPLHHPLGGSRRPERYWRQDLWHR